MERPTAIEALYALAEAQAQEPVTPVKDAKDGVIVDEWEWIDGTSEDCTFLGLVVVIQGLTYDWFVAYPVHKEREEHRNSNDLSGLTLVPFPLFLDSMQPHHSRSSSTHRIKRRLTRAEKRVRDFMHLQRHTSMAAALGTTDKPAPGTEIVDQREEEVSVREGNISYLVSRPIPKGKTLRKVVVTVVSKDQGWSSYLADYGTYRNSWTWFELSVGPPDGSGPKWRGEVVKNLHAHSDFKEHTVEILDGELYREAESGDVLTVWAYAPFAGWKNTVKKVTIRYVVE